MMYKIKWIALAILILGAAGGVYGLYTLIAPSPKYLENPTPAAVLKQIRSLARLETTSYTVEKIIDVQTSTSQGVIQEFLFGDKLLLIATGEVIAGIDLGKLTPEQVRMTDGKITLSLPAPEIFTTQLNETQTRVYDRQTGLLTKADRDLESTARTRAVEQIRAAACEGGLLEKANDNARAQLTALLKGAGVEDLVILTTGTTVCK